MGLSAEEQLNTKLPISCGTAFFRRAFSTCKHLQKGTVGYSKAVLWSSIGKWCCSQWCQQQLIRQPRSVAAECPHCLQQHLGKMQLLS